MIPIFKHAINQLFNRLAVDALYQVNGDNIPIKVILKSPDQIIDFRDTQIYTSTHMLEVRITDIPKPKAGHEILLNGTKYRVQGEPVKDIHHLLWKLEVIK